MPLTHLLWRPRTAIPCTKIMTSSSVFHSLLDASRFCLCDPLHYQVVHVPVRSVASWWGKGNKEGGGENGGGGTGKGDKKRKGGGGEKPDASAPGGEEGGHIGSG